MIEKITHIHCYCMQFTYVQKQQNQLTSQVSILQNYSAPFATNRRAI
jgi:hypothetical protein